MPEFEVNATVDIDESELIDWCQTNMEINQLFSEEEIIEFIQNNFEADDIFDIDAFPQAAAPPPAPRIGNDGAFVKDYAQEHFSPDDVFDIIELETWAENHGFVLKD